MKYEHIKLVAKAPCSHCDGRGEIIIPGHSFSGGASCRSCPTCHGTGETETELLHKGEPFFLIRGHDQLGPAMIAVYKALGETADADVQGLDELELAMHDFQEANPGLVKLAD